MLFEITLEGVTGTRSITVTKIGLVYMMGSLCMRSRQSESICLIGLLESYSALNFSARMLLALGYIILIKVATFIITIVTYYM